MSIPQVIFSHASPSISAICCFKTSISVMVWTSSDEMGEIRGIVTGCFQSYSYFIFFCAVETGSICNVAVHLLLRNQAGVVHSLPFPSLFIPCNIGIVGFAFVPAFRPEEAGYEAGGPASRNPCHFHFDAKVQCFHNHLCPFYVCVCSFGTLYITLKAHNSKLF